MKALVSIPFFRILLPFVAGILFSVFFPQYYPGHVFTFIFLFISGLAAFVRGFKNKYLFLFTADVFLFLLGCANGLERDARRQPDHYSHFINEGEQANLLVVPDELPLQQVGRVKCSVRVIRVVRKDSSSVVTGNCLVYFKTDNPDSFLRPGVVVVLRTRLRPFQPPQNPGTFDYKTWMERRQIYHSAFVSPGDWQLQSQHYSLNPLWLTGLKCKQYVLDKLRHSGLSPTAFGICSALLTGYDDEIDRSLLTAFSHSGTLHVLSVSGLHTGLIYLALSFLFDLIDRKRRYKLVRFIFMTLLLWGFALLTGFPAPVLRAVIQLNLMGMGAILFRNHPQNQLNLLLASAFALLLFNPFYLLDVGFLLSYFAMAGLICFSPALSAFWQPESFILKAAWQSVCASVAATISTLPLTLFFFKQFPLWFFVTNLVVIPVTFIMLFLTLTVLVSIPFCVGILNGITVFLTGFVSLSDVAGPGYIDNIDFIWSDALFLSLLIVLFASAFRSRNFVWMRMGICCLIIWQVVAFAQSFVAKTTSQLTVYALRHRTCLSVKNKTQVLIDSVPAADYDFHIRPQMISYNYGQRSRRDTSVNFIDAGSQRILLLNRPGFWPIIPSDSVTGLIVSADVAISTARIKSLKALRFVVADGRVPARRQKALKKLCANAGLDFHATSYSGAFVLSLD